MGKTAARVATLILFCILVVACARTEVVESPRTTYIPDNQTAVEPAIVWTSRTLSQDFDYLGELKVRAWSYDGALSRLVDAAKDLKADAVIDIHYEKIGFLSSMQAFAIKYK